MSDPHPARFERLALVISGAWLAAGVFFATEGQLVAIARGEPVDFPRRPMEIAVGSVVWALFTPIVIWFAARYPVSPPHRARNTLIITAFAVPFAAVRSLIDAFASPALAGHLTTTTFQQTFFAVFHTNFMFTIVIALITNFVRLQRDVADREGREARVAAELAKAHLQQLRADLQPHFLFNTLNAIATLVHTDPAAAERTVVTLRDLLRRSVAARDRVAVTLAEDLDFVERYLELQKTRFGERLRTRVIIDDPVLLEATVPPLLLQPLVENAIKHSIGPRAQGGRVEIRAFVQNERLHLQVRDDGPGFDPERIARMHSVGLPNTIARLVALYGERQSIDFRHAHGDFIAEVIIPLEGQRWREAS